MGTFTENSLADVMKVFRHLNPDKEDAVLIESLVELLGFTVKREPQSPPPPPPPPPKRAKLDDLSEDLPPQKPKPPSPKQRKSLSKLQLNTLKEPHGHSMPQAIRDAVALWDGEPEMPTVSLMSYTPSVPLLPVNQARSYIHDTLSTETFLDELDVDELIEQMARGAVPTITYIRKKLLQGPVHVMIDKNRSMEPFEHDADEFYQYITRLIGEEACEGYWCFDTLDDDVVRISDNEWFKRYPSLKPLPQTLLVLVSDLGAARPFGWSSVPRHRWSACLQRLAPLFSRIVVVSPYPKKRLPGIRTRNIEIVPWGKVRYVCSGDEESVLHDLASLIAPAAYLNRDIIRSARATFYPECYPGLEADLIFSWMMAVSNPLVLSFRPETQRELRGDLMQDQLLRKKAHDFLNHYREHCRQFTLPEWIAFEEELMQQALNGERQAVDDKVRRLIRTLIEFEEHPRLARWALSVAKALSEEHASLKDRQELQLAAALRLGIVPREFEQSGDDNSNSWLLPKETTIGIRQEEGQLRFVDKPDVEDIRISVPGTVPRFLKIEGGDGTNQLVRLWKGHDDVMVPERLLPMAISTLSGARYRLSKPVAPFDEIKILIAVPSDVTEERMIVANEIEKWNIDNSDIHRIVCEAVLWDTHSQTTIGERPQEIINWQIVDRCDFAIAVFHSRIGTNTSLTLRDTVEEVRRMIDQGKQVLCWFSEMPLPPDVDVEQLVQLKDFRNELQSKAICDTYKDLNDFREKVAYQLAQYMSILTRRAAASMVMAGQLLPEANNALMRYQEFLRREIERIALIGVPAIEGLSVALSEVFVSLRLSETRQSVERFRSGMQDGYRSGTPEEVMRFAFSSHRLLLVLGDPGSGKSTLLNYYALSCLEGIHESLGFTAPVPVIRLPLREMKRKKGGYSSLPASLANWCARNYLDEIRQEHCAEWLATSETLVLLDGLDEISDMKDRINMCHWIDLMVKSYGNARFVVTSRGTGYRKSDGIEIETPHVRADIMDFTQEQQDAFLHKWFQAAYLREFRTEDMPEQEWQEMQAKRAREKSENIIDYLNQEHNRSLRVLASQPLLLQIMALLWKERRYLPGSRTELFDAALYYLLDYRDRRKNIQPLLSAEEAYGVLASVALWMQEMGVDAVEREAMHKKVQNVLDTLSISVKASAFCRYLVDRAGVLVEYGESEYVFRQKVFLEYLANVQLAKLLSKKKEPKETNITPETLGNDEESNNKESKKPNITTKTPESVEEYVTGRLNKNVVLFIGPSNVGKTVALIRLVHYLENNRGIYIRPNTKFRTDEGYKKSVESFYENLNNSYFTPERTGVIDFLVLDVIKDSDIYCQFLEAPGEAYFDPNKKNDKSFPPYLDGILSENTNKIFVFFFEENMLSDSDSLAYSEKMVSLVSYMNQKKDNIIIVFNKSDKRRELYRNNRPNRKAFKDMILNDVKYRFFFSAINKIRVPVRFVVFSGGMFSSIPNYNQRRWVHSADSFPKTLWDAIEGCLKPSGWW